MPEIRHDPAIYPPEGSRNLLTADVPATREYERLPNRTWTQAKSGG